MCFCAENAAEVAVQLADITNNELSKEEVGVQTAALLCPEIQSGESINSSSSPLRLSAGVSSGDEGEAAGERGEDQQHVSLHRRHHHLQRHEQHGDGVHQLLQEVRPAGMTCPLYTALLYTTVY